MKQLKLVGCLALIFSLISSIPADAQSVLNIPECQLSKPGREVAYVFTTYTLIWNELKRRYPDKNLRACYTRSFTVIGRKGDYQGWYESYGMINAVIEVSTFSSRNLAEEVGSFVRGRHNVTVITAPYRLRKHP